MNQSLPLWQRLLATIIVMLIASYLAGLIWHSIFGIPLPSYVAGLIGGLAGIPVWDFMRRIRPRS